MSTPMTMEKVRNRFLLRPSDLGCLQVPRASSPVVGQAARPVRTKLRRADLTVEGNEQCGVLQQREQGIKVSN